MLSGLFFLGRFIPSRSRSRFWRDVASRPLVISPPAASEIFPVSSETTITRASVSSDSPIAALCRVPRSLSRSGSVASGKNEPADNILLPTIIIPPSWRGEDGLNMLIISSLDTSASILMPISMKSERLLFLSIAMSAPMRRLAM